jgi:ribose 1,5-bisphosphokinase PhnN
MTDRSELAERLMCFDEKTNCLICLSGPERDLIIAALRSSELPSEEEIARVIVRTCEDVGENEDEFCSDRMALASARAVLALLGKTGDEK